MVMTTGMATIAGTVLVLYTTLLGAVLDDAVGHLLTASIISVPAAIMMAWLMVPPDRPPTPATLHPDAEETQSAMEAITHGTERGLALYLNIVAMLLVLVALVQLGNGILGLFPEVAGAPLTIERALGWLMAPVAWLMGVPWSGGRRRQPHGHQNRVQRVPRLSRARGPAPGRARRAQRPDHELCALRKSIVAGTLATCCTGAVVGLII